MTSNNLKVEFIDNAASQYDEYADRIKFLGKGAKPKMGKLFLGDRNAASYLQLKFRECKAVVNCCSETHGLARETDVKYLKIDPDDEDGVDYFQKSFDFIDGELSQKRNILVHCGNGFNKSAMIVIYYVMRRCEVSLAEAYEIVKSSRKKALKIRPALMQELIKAEKTVRGSISLMMDGRRIIVLDSKVGKVSGEGNSISIITILTFIALFFALIFAVLFAATGKL